MLRVSLSNKLGVAVGLCWASLVLAKSPLIDIELRSDYVISEEPLTTDSLWTVDRGQPNPHRQRWGLYRRTETTGFKVVVLENAKFGIKTDQVRSQLRSYLRGPGPWYTSWSQFTCEKEPNSWFGTQEGTKVAAAAAAEYWSEVLREKKVQLSVLLGRVAENSESLALERGQSIFKTWLAQVNQEWRAGVTARSRKEEWKYYLEQLSSRANNEPGEKVSCHLGQVKNISPPSWKTRMEPIPAGGPPPISKLLARAPVRLWDGLFTIRLGVQIGGKLLSGRFLIDSGLNKSVLSPEWLEGQGVYPIWLIVPGVPLEKVTWGFREFEGGLAQSAQVEKTFLGNLELPLTDFLVTETDFFNPPETAGTCCDGALGRDFLRLYPMEFDSHIPSEVRVWPRENFQWSKETPWLELSETPTGNLVSSCLGSRVGKESGIQKLQGLGWLTGSEDALSIHQPWWSGVGKNSSWKIDCDGVELIASVKGEIPELAPRTGSQGPFSQKYPAASIGMPLLSRGNFIFDLPHGRIWLPSDGLKLPVPKKNTSGLELEFVMEDGDRVLKVTHLSPQHSGLKGLLEAGLRQGSTITEINGKDPADMDQYEVDRSLAAGSGSTINIQWETNQGLKMAPLVIH